MSQDKSDDWAQALGSIAIDRPSEVVFSFVCDPRNDGRWLTNVGDVEFLTPGPVRIGSRFRQFPIFLGARVEVEWEVTEFVPNCRMAGRSVAGPITFERSIDCAPVGSGTRLTNFVNLHIPFVLPLVTSAAANVLLHKAAERALARLKTLLEDATHRAPPATAVLSDGEGISKSQG